MLSSIKAWIAALEATDVSDTDKLLDVIRLTFGKHHPVSEAVADLIADNERYIEERFWTR